MTPPKTTRTPLANSSLLLCAALLALPARADQPARPLLAVLEFATQLTAAEKQDADPQYFSDVVRAQALDELPDARLMTRENMTVLLEAAGKDLAACEGECEVDTGRKLGADYVITGRLLKVGSSFKLDLKLHATADGRLLQGAVAAGKSVDDLDAALPAAVTKLLGPLRPPAKTALARAPPVVAAAPSSAPAAVPAAPPGAPAALLEGSRFEHIKIQGSRIFHRESFFAKGKVTVDPAVAPMVREAARLIAGPPPRAAQVVCRAEAEVPTPAQLRNARQRAVSIKHALVEAGAPARLVTPVWVNPRKQALRAGLAASVLHPCELLLQ